MSVLALIPFRVWFVAGLLAAAAAGLAWWSAHERGEGERKAIEQINRQNEEARNAAISGARDVRACADAGGVWNLRRGKCEGN